MTQANTSEMPLHSSLVDSFTDQSPFDIVWQAAICAALTHHAVMKIPQQPDTALAIFPSLIFVNAGFIGILVYKATSLISSLGCLLLFNIFFVFSLIAPCLIQCALTTVLQILHNVYFRHRNIPGLFWYKATDLTYPSTLFTSSGRFNVKGLKKLQKMHAEMGKRLHRFPLDGR